MGYFIFLIYAIRTVRTILYHLFWWERKEYRFDRMKVHLSETIQGKKWMFGKVSLVKWVLLLAFVFPFTRFLDWLVIGVYIVEAGISAIQFTSDKRPSGPRPKVIVVFLGALAFELFIVPILAFDFPLGLALLVGDKLLPFVITIEMMIVSVIFWFYKQSKIEMAREKLSSAGNLTIIAVTGSYGKTSVKEFAHQILSRNYRTLKTEKSQNSDIGVAELILKTDLAQYDYFVCEMAAYHPGEIRSSTSILGERIAVAIVTGINEQHQSLFGSLETTKKAKYELIDATRKNGTVIVNALNEGAKEMGERAEKEGYAVTFVTEKDLVKTLPAHTAPHFRINATLASLAAKAIGMKQSEITASLGKLQLPEKTMHEEKRGKILIIDDTFNANPDAVYAALDYIKRKKGKKIVVLQPLIELGKYANEVHEKIGKMAGEVCDQVVLTSINWNEAFMRGVAQAKNKKAVVRVRGSVPAIESGVILFEGKEAESYMVH